jgi:TrmH family RNA methyltransferase
MSILISSTSNPKVKEIVQLLTKARSRKQNGLCVVEGAREIERAVAANWVPRDLWFIQGVEYPAWVSEFRNHFEVNQLVFNKIAYRSGTEAFVATFETPEYSSNHIDEVFQKAKCLLIVEGIEKPGNAGALLRTAVAAGVDAVVVADGALDIYGPNVMRNATGAVFELPVLSMTNQAVQDQLAKNAFQTYITHMHSNATNLFDVQWGDKCAIVLGEEARGLSSQWLDKEYTNTVIPMEGTNIDSLNVSVAAAVMMYHWKANRSV